MGPYCIVVYPKFNTGEEFLTHICQSCRLQNPSVGVHVKYTTYSPIATRARLCKSLSAEFDLWLCGNTWNHFTKCVWDFNWKLELKILFDFIMILLIWNKQTLYIMAAQLQYIPRNMHTVFALLWLYIDWFSHIPQAYFTGTVAI